MQELPKHYVYTPEVIDFVTVAAQTCLLLEHLDEIGRHDLLDKLLKLLPLLYLKTQLLSLPEQELEGYSQQFVSEDDYNAVQDGIKSVLGTDDAYLEVFMEDMRYSDEPITAFLSENLADIYQELKDMAANYQTAEEDIMNDAVLSCLEAFKQHWGQKLLNALRALHALWVEAGDMDEDGHHHCGCDDDDCDCHQHHHCGDDCHCHD